MHLRDADVAVQKGLLDGLVGPGYITDSFSWLWYKRQASTRHKILLMALCAVYLHFFQRHSDKGQEQFLRRLSFPLNYFVRWGEVLAYFVFL